MAKILLYTNYSKTGRIHAAAEPGKTLCGKSTTGMFRLNGTDDFPVDCAGCLKHIPLVVPAEEKPFDVVSFVMALEGGELSDGEIIKGMAELIKSGMVNGLQGSYGRCAASLIRAGYITPYGEITDKGREVCDA
jgi:hypothetical protein